MRWFSLFAFIVGLAAGSNVMAEDAPAIPAGVDPLTSAEIMRLLDGRTFKFTAYDEPLVGVSNWNTKKKTVSGTYVWNNKEKATYEVDWVIEAGKN